jgi:hypothetical protein
LPTVWKKARSSGLIGSGEIMVVAFRIRLNPLLHNGIDSMS